MTYGRVHYRDHSHSRNDAVVSHPAQLVRGGLLFIFQVVGLSTVTCATILRYPP
jgi:hypothetical protein